MLYAGVLHKAMMKTAGNITNKYDMHVVYMKGDTTEPKPAMFLVLVGRLRHDDVYQNNSSTRSKQHHHKSMENDFLHHRA